MEVVKGNRRFLLPVKDLKKNLEEFRNFKHDFTKEQRKIRNDWILNRNKKLKENPEAYKNHIDGFQAWAKATFGDGGGNK